MANRILVLDHGRLVEKGVYAKLYKIQFQDSGLVDQKTVT